jgi:hypothetical protein
MTSFRSFLPPSLVTLVILLLAASPADAAPIHVPADHATIQAAINAAANGDIIIVSDGIYTENIDFKGKAITVRSANGPSTTIIDGGDISCVVKFVTGETSASVLTELTIRNGRSAASCGTSGGGIFVSNASPTITRNIISNNSGCVGMGIGVRFGSPLIQDNLIIDNYNVCSGGGGGGISLGGASPAQIIGNTITSNSAGNADGGGIFMNAAGTPIIRGNLISENTSYEGGAIAMLNNSTPVISDNIIIQNSAFRGGGIAASVPSGSNGPRIINNTIAGNKATFEGSQLYLEGFASKTQVWNNILFGASAPAAVVCDTLYDPTPPVLRFNDGFNTIGPAYAGSCANVTGTNGNISADPLFVSFTSDLRLQPTSPAIDAGANTAPGLPSTDFAGNPRLFDGNGDGTATVDLGAYEIIIQATLALAPTGLTFPGQIVGSPGSPQTVTLTNTGAVPITISQVAVTGDFAQTTTCGTSVAPAASCTFEVTFMATEAGDRTGALTIMDNASGGPHSVALTGTGQDFSIEAAPGGTMSAAIEAGDTATYQLQVSPVGGFASTVTLTCAGAPDGSDCTVSPGQVTPSGAAVPFTVSVATSASTKTSAGAARIRTPGVGHAAIIVALALLAAGSLVRGAAPSRRRRRSRLIPAFAFVLLAGFALSCGDNERPAGTPGTTPGSYELVITGTVNGRTHTLTLPLTVR